MKGILFASFGTTHPPARQRQIDGVADYIASALPEYMVAQGYTSSMVRSILERDGIFIPDPVKALEQMAEQGVTHVVVQPGLLLPGQEHHKLCRLARSRQELFQRMGIGQPLLATTHDLYQLAELLSLEYPRQSEQAVVLMGHGTSFPSNAAYHALDHRFQEIGRPDIYVGTVEAHPSLDTITHRLEGQACRRLLLAPLMQVAGDHALHDMAGTDENSWASRLTALGYQVECSMRGLGEMPAVREMYLEHIRRALKIGDSHGL